MISFLVDSQLWKCPADTLLLQPKPRGSAHIGSWLTAGIPVAGARRVTAVDRSGIGPSSRGEAAPTKRTYWAGPPLPLLRP